MELIKNGISLDNIETLTPVTCDKLGDDIESNIRYSRLRGFETCNVYLIYYYRIIEKYIKKRNGDMIMKIYI